MPWITLIQVGLLVAWYTVAPTLPVWVVFLPLILAAVAFAAVGMCALGVVLVAAVASK